MKNKLVEKQTVERNYGFLGIIAIIDSIDFGRILIMDGYGGESQMRGGAVRFDHGLVVSIKDGDTLNNLNKTEWNDSTTLMQAVCKGYDNDRPILDFSPVKLAKSVKLD